MAARRSACSTNRDSPADQPAAGDHHADVIILSFQTPFDRNTAPGNPDLGPLRRPDPMSSGPSSGSSAFGVSRMPPRVLTYSVSSSPIAASCACRCWTPSWAAGASLRVGQYRGFQHRPVDLLIVLKAGSQQEIKLRRALLNPGTVALLIGLPRFGRHPPAGAADAGARICRRRSTRRSPCLSSEPRWRRSHCTGSQDPSRFPWPSRGACSRFP